MIKQFLFLLLTGTSLTCLSEPLSAATWHTDLSAARKEAARLNRPLLLHFYADWCGPCRVMDANVLHRQELGTLLKTRMVGVKVNIDARQDLIQLYRIRKYPADVVLSPEGQVLMQSGGAKQLQPYLAMLSTTSGQYEAIVKRKQQRELLAKQAEEKRQRELLAAQQAAEAEAKKQSEPLASSGSQQATPRILGLLGYCPVSLSQDRKWWKGNPKYQWEYQGVVFYMKTEEELKKFRELPHQYAPRLLGCDPVKLADTDQALTGDIRYGAFYDGSLYLFTNNESRKLFKTKPERFVQTRHVLRDDILNPTLIK